MKKIIFSFAFLITSIIGYSQTDGCGSPTSLSVNTTCVNTGFTVNWNGTGQVVNASCATSGTAYEDGWFSVVGTGNIMTITVSGTNRAVVLAAFTGCGTGELICDIQSSGVTASINFATTNLTTYYIQIQRRSGNNNANLSGNICAVSAAGGGGGAGDGSSCSNSETLTLGTQQCGTNSNAGDFPDGGGAPTNPCNNSYNDGEYWYSFTGTGQALQLDVSGLTASYSGLFVLDDCPSGTPTCVASYTSGSSTSNFTLTTPGLTNGQTYYIVMANWSAPYQTDYCIDATEVAPPVPPVNDDCGGAIALTVNPDLACGTTIAGTVVNATASTQDMTACSGTEDDDVWFSFVATGTVHSIDLLNVSGSTTDMAHSVWSGTCPGSLVLVAGSCSDPNSQIVTGLTSGNTYYVRVYTYTATTGQTSTFDICIGTPTPPPANDECSGAISITVNPDYLCGSITSGTVASATASSQSTASCGGTEDDDVWFSFVATGTIHTIDVLNITGSTTDMYHSVWSGTCPGSLSLVAGSCSDPNSQTVTGLTVGNTYYVRVYTWTSTTGQTSTFDICIGSPPPPPTNDDCGGAIGLTVNPDFLCGATTTSSVGGATASSQSTAACSGTEDDDVWFSFVATATDHKIDLLNISGSTTDLAHSLWEGTCPGSLTLVTGTCSDPNSQSVIGLTIGSTYYLRVYTYTSTTGQTTVFDVCIGTPAPPTCTDGIQNQGETGIDCGGPCPAICPPTFTPTACSSTTQNVPTLSNITFYDDGGANPDPAQDPCSDGPSGGFSNANCTTTVTFTAPPGEYLLCDFREFAMYNTTSGFDWMKIYDNNAASGTTLFDNESSGVDNPFGSCGISGQAMDFCSSGRSLTFEFFATSVVNRQGWDALITATSTACVLPVEMLSFEGEAKEDANLLTWTTATEINNSHFEVQRSKDGINFIKIGEVSGSGNSSVVQDYNFKDYTITENIEYYRLKQIDFDGKYDYTNIIVIENNNNTFNIMRVYPNPSKNIFNYELYSLDDDHIELKVANLVGEVVRKEIISLNEGGNLITSDLSEIAKGVYFVKFTNYKNELLGITKIIKK